MPKQCPRQPDPVSRVATHALQPCLTERALTLNGSLTSESQSALNFQQGEVRARSRRSDLTPQLFSTRRIATAVTNFSEIDFSERRVRSAGCCPFQDALGIRQLARTHERETADSIYALKSFSDASGQRKIGGSE